ncbi:glutathione transferase [Pelomonas sp. P7]|uniref:Glutathione transferase n=1 Tax=Pelomonas caseinilytica TaxID=2906763 RepID=A0ABS8X9J8_9BURK|nr:glutathione transferase [Pelomonas sp. P7]MCE4535795.1 glutathione transferase [Pelomonas sp. P7]
MKLYVDREYASPWAMAVFVGLREKGLGFDVEVLDLAAGDQRQAGFARQSLTQRVPTLVDGDFSLSESTAILEYLDDTQAGPDLLPREPRQRARARQLQAWLRSDLGALRAERSTEVVFYRPTDKPLTAAGQAAASKLIAAATQLLDGRDYLFGTWSVADVDLAVMLNRLILNGDPVPDALKQYAARQWQRPSVQAWVQLERPPL